MKINKIEIKNFRGIEKVEIDFLSSMNIFVGINGAGKSSILDAIVISLSWLANRIQRENSPGRPITDESIRNGSSSANIKIIVSEEKKNYSWNISKTARGNPVENRSDLNAASELATSFQTFLNDNETLPVIAYYPINRVVDKIVPEILGNETINILDIYENALGGKTNYQSFFEWFRLQDDIVNEKAKNRSLWMKQNKSWLKKRIKKLLSYLDVQNEREGEYKWFNQITNLLTKDEFIFEEPRFLFRELIELIHASEFIYRDNYKFAKIMHDIEYMMHKMMSFSDSRQDNLIDVDKFPFSTVGSISEKLFEISQNEKNNESQNMVSFVWESFSLATHLTIWWLSDKGKLELDKLFAKFNPGKNRSTLILDSNDFQLSISTIMYKEVKRFENATKSGGRETRWVTHAIENFISNYQNLRVTRIPRPRLLVDKDGVTISLDQLSDGEKNLIALIGDIARRLSIGNPYRNNPLEGNGIILIDEIDLHLHPAWQRLMIPHLVRLFPNCQFIITTHSPQVLSHTKPENIFILKNNKGVLSLSKPTESYGQTTDRILEDILDVDARPKEEKDLLRKLFREIQDGGLVEAKITSAKLKNLIGEDPELVKANILIKRKEAIGK